MLILKRNIKNIMSKKITRVSKLQSALEKKIKLARVNLLMNLKT